MDITSTATIQAPTDHEGTLIDTGFTVGERVIVTIAGETFEREVQGPAARPHERMQYGGTQWQRRINAEPALWVCVPGHPDLRMTVACSRIERVGVPA
jgi:hypothetical protein